MPEDRPHLSGITPAPTPAEAAALIAAVNRFLHDHAPAAGAPAEPPVSGWVRAARSEAIDREPEHPTWGR